MKTTSTSRRIVTYYREDGPFSPGWYFVYREVHFMTSTGPFKTKQAAMKAYGRLKRHMASFYAAAKAGEIQ